MENLTSSSSKTIVSYSYKANKKKKKAKMNDYKLNLKLTIHEKEGLIYYWMRRLTYS